MHLFAHNLHFATLVPFSARSGVSEFSFLKILENTEIHKTSNGNVQSSNYVKNVSHYVLLFDIIFSKMNEKY